MTCSFRVSKWVAKLDEDFKSLTTGDTDITGVVELQACFLC